MSQVTACVFCSLSQQPDLHVYHDEHTFAVRDIKPAAPGHTIVINRRHVASVFDLDDTEFVSLAHALREVRVDLTREYGVEAFNVVMNSGADAGQTVFHAHAHLIPRGASDRDSRLPGLEDVVGSR